MDLKVKGLSGKRRVIIETDRIGDWENAFPMQLSCGMTLLSAIIIGGIG